ncbi:hypothetical protein AB0E01_43900 [Nocardia vinacea]|uniref:hypothetical protein n=1 Tax=Nocardia vinacea TaxID=96468 RepID=UPI0033EAE3F9
MDGAVPVGRRGVLLHTSGRGFEPLCAHNLIELRDKGRPVVPPPNERLAQVRETVKTLRDLDGPDRHTPVAMAVLGPKARALAAEVAETVTFALGDQPRAEVARLAHEFRTSGDIELALAVPVIGDTVAPHMAHPDTNAAALCGGRATSG